MIGDGDTPHVRISRYDTSTSTSNRVLLLGASGAGKSTLMSGLAGVLGGDDEGEQEGELLIDGVDARQARGRCGLVLQDPDSQTILERAGDDTAFGEPEPAER